MRRPYARYSTDFRAGGVVLVERGDRFGPTCARADAHDPRSWRSRRALGRFGSGDSRSSEPALRSRAFAPRPARPSRPSSSNSASRIVQS